MRRNITDIESIGSMAWRYCAARSMRTKDKQVCTPRMRPSHGLRSRRTGTRSIHAGRLTSFILVWISG